MDFVSFPRLTVLNEFMRAALSFHLADERLEVCELFLVGGGDIVERLLHLRGLGCEGLYAGALVLLVLASLVILSRSGQRGNTAIMQHDATQPPA